MTKRILAIAFIFAVTSLAWLALGATIFARTESSGRQLTGRVGSTWGTSQSQQAPVAFTEKIERQVVETPDRRRPPGRQPAALTDTTAAARTETVRIRSPLSLDQTRAAVAFELDHRRKGLLWYSTYAVSFDGAFRFTNTTASDSVIFEFPLPAAQAIYDDLRVTLNGAPTAYETRGHAIVATARVPRGDSTTLAVAYRSRGLNEWRYVLGNDVTAVRDFNLVMRTNFDDIDFPDNTLSPTTEEREGDGWKLQWTYANLLSGFQIGMDMPQKLQPGPLAGEIAFFAPVSLLFFFALMFIIVTIRRIDLHPMNYAFLAAAFFAFHLLLAYLVDHISIHVAFLIASAVSIALVVSYLRLVIGPRFAFREAALAQFMYLVLFSYAFFFKGFTGLAITIGSVLTLFAAMQLTGRVRWSDVFASGPPRGSRSVTG
ncbi:MAG TPA: inner membrane CreD family protein [Gemmatimonadaceae bacterium]|nr:inner membrane CreD family protein [Gemmatimonadaceae bacterium]